MRAALDVVHALGEFLRSRDDRRGSRAGLGGRGDVRGGVRCHIRHGEVEHRMLTLHALNTRWETDATEVLVVRVCEQHLGVSEYGVVDPRLDPRDLVLRVDGADVLVLPRGE